MSKKKYMLHPGKVVSATDGDVSYVSAPQLARLFAVPFDECVTAWRQSPEDVNDPLDPAYIHLFPEPSGDYRLPGRDDGGPIRP